VLSYHVCASSGVPFLLFGSDPRLEAVVPRSTIALKTRIAEALVARGLGAVFLR
jgi:hypothetical protein